MAVPVAADAVYPGVSPPNQVKKMKFDTKTLNREELVAKKSYFQLNRKEQWELAERCVTDLKNDKNISIKAEEKSGKRGIMECIHVNLCLEYSSDEPFCELGLQRQNLRPLVVAPPKSIYITALNRKDTKVQLIEQEGYGITSCILQNATKSSELLGRIVEIMSDESNNSMVYIHLDECDYGTGDKQSLSKLYNRPEISQYKNRIKFITYSATPEELEKSSKIEVPDWSFHRFNPADTYFGAQKYLDNKLIYTPKEFFNGINITTHGKEIIDEVKVNCLNESNPKKVKQRNIIVVRAATGQLNVIDSMKATLEEDNGCEIHIYDQKNGFEWGDKMTWSSLGKEEVIDEDGDVVDSARKYKPVVIFICGTCTRSTEIHCLGHKRIYAWHDYRFMSKCCYNTLSQAIGRVKHYTNGEENTIKLYCDINIILTTLNMPTPGLKEKDKKLSQRVKVEKNSFYEKKDMVRWRVPEVLTLKREKFEHIIEKNGNKFDRPRILELLKKENIDIEGYESSGMWNAPTIDTDAYKKNIIPLLNAFNNKKKFCLLHKDKKEKNIKMYSVYFDKKDYKVIILKYDGDITIDHDNHDEEEKYVHKTTNKSMYS